MKPFKIELFDNKIPIFRVGFIANPYFIGGLAVLLLNDHFLKWYFSNMISGKLSDFAGVYILPLFLAGMLPLRKKYTLWFTGLFFIWWKSPFSESFILGYNQLSPIPITRVVDYTDYLALILLPLSFWTLKRLEYRSERVSRARNFLSIPLLGLSIFAFMATAPPSSFYYRISDGNMVCENCKIRVRMSKAEVIGALRESGLFVERDTPMLKSSLQLGNWDDDFSTPSKEWPFYNIKELYIENDTLQDIQFALVPIDSGRTIIHLNGMQVSQDMTDARLSRSLSRWYGKGLKAHFKKILK